MLDSFEILTTSGVVLWSKTYAPTSPSIINSLITSVFIEERTLPGAGVADDISAANNPPYKYDQHTCKWTTVKELGLIFVAVYRSLLHLSWIDKLVDNIKIIFVELYGDQLRKPHTTIVKCAFDDYFDQQIRQLEKTALNRDTKVAESTALRAEAPASVTQDFGNEPPPLPGILSRGASKNNYKDLTSNESTPIATPDTSRPSTPASHLLTGKGGPGGKGSRRARKAANTPTAYASSGDELQSKRDKASKPAVAKKGRKWDADGLADEDSDTPLDYSAPANGATSGEDEIKERPGAMKEIDQSSWGWKNEKGEFFLKDLDDQVDSILASATAKKTDTVTSSTGIVGSSISAIGGYFRSIVGGKTLTKEDLEKPMKAMEDHLLRKNVAREAAIRLCEGVERELIGVKTENFESIQTRIESAMESSLQKMLTPTSSHDLVLEINAIKKQRPYVISIVGVNGVGKSTNLSKICFFLLQRNFKVLVVACDTFRSGAVEQLAVHVRNLKELTAREGTGKVELYQKGYGKDAANVAKDAVTFGAQEGYDVVLIDTAGRRHNDQRLMSSLEKFANFAKPDKILMVGEALVGTDSVAQARNFNAAFGNGRSLDGFIISKCDTVGDMVGTLVSMVHATNVPVLFVGTGQHYNDLRGLSVQWALKKLMSSN
ncbi:P-loop containing nucleoside triphosphate hydrolase protein [Mollisia scopiformis]|uniref:Signal recognition particle receptor subunit alpha homolog n=1 Tax=Mollisia scopiformis TaxID=149040 RepID=A0A194XTC2_MOLSC|nr:P-loop containing nucleoside triphosphate hydrolase protein [Mollisia scopiformis]KUJ23565.1 P-loop containing nucleoside triphosphate hydrolase protein [Mollisia scopiformis]